MSETFGTYSTQNKIFGLKLLLESLKLSRALPMTPKAETPCPEEDESGADAVTRMLRMI